MPRYTFTPLREEHFDTARRWLLEPHVRRWWDEDPMDTDYPESVLDRWRRSVRGEIPTDRFLIRIDGRPVGQIQSYRVADHPAYAAEIDIGEPAIAIDLFIGERALIGKGHGPALIAAFLRDVAFPRYGIDYCVIGPAAENVAAIRAYEKAGFRRLKDYREEDTRAPMHVLLDLRRSDLV
jgi:RimJ/RimL family protein N-acetyltransferase